MSCQLSLPNFTTKHGLAYHAAFKSGSRFGPLQLLSCLCSSCVSKPLRFVSAKELAFEHMPVHEDKNLTLNHTPPKTKTMITNFQQRRSSSTGCWQNTSQGQHWFLNIILGVVFDVPVFKFALICLNYVLFAADSLLLL